MYGRHTFPVGESTMVQPTSELLIMLLTKVVNINVFNLFTIVVDGFLPRDYREGELSGESKY